jgi:hypothetical protein
MIDATALLRLYASYRGRALARQDTASTQRQQLTQLIRRAAGTWFGRDHGFGSIRGIADFQKAVPLRRY